MTLRFHTTPAAPPTRPRLIAKQRFSERAINREAREALARVLAADFGDILSSFIETIDRDALAQAVSGGGRISIIEEALGVGRLHADLAVAFAEDFTAGVLEGAKIGLRFAPPEFASIPPDLVTQFAADFIDTRVGDLVTEISRNTRRGIQQTVRSALLDELSPTQAAERIASQVGLTERQATAVDNFRTKTTRRMIPTPDADTPQARAAIEREVARYQERALFRRGELIGRHEMQNAIQTGERQLWEVAVANGEVDRDAITRTWFTSGDPCEICIPFHGITVGMDEEFPEGDPPEPHIGCNCYIEWGVRPLGT